MVILIIHYLRLIKKQLIYHLQSKMWRVPSVENIFMFKLFPDIYCIWQLQQNEIVHLWLLICYKYFYNNFLAWDPRFSCINFEHSYNNTNNWDLFFTRKPWRKSTYQRNLKLAPEWTFNVDKQINRQISRCFIHAIFFYFYLMRNEKKSKYFSKE